MKLLCFVLLVAAVAAAPNFGATVQTMSKMLHSVRMPRLQADPQPSACQVKMMAIMMGYPTFGECSDMMDQGIGKFNDSTATRFCGTLNCIAPIRAYMNLLLYDPACAAYKDLMGPMAAMMMPMMDVICMNAGGKYCMPMFESMGEMMPNMSAPMNDQMLDASVCHPCMGGMIDFMARMSLMFGNQTIFHDMPTPVMMRSMMNIMCRRSMTGGYCLPKVQLLKSEFEHAEHFVDGSDDFINAWKTLLPKMCVDVCLRDFLTGYVQIISPSKEGSTPDPDLMSANRALARLMSYCIKDPVANEFCAIRMMEKTKALAWTTSECVTFDQLSEHVFSLPVCGVECAMKFQRLINETGCCARSLMINTAPEMRDHVAIVSKACNIEWPTVSECIKRLNITIKPVVFRNLKYSWVMANKALVVASLQRDFAAAFKVMPQDVDIIFGQALLSRPTIPYLFATESATTVTPVVNANADQQSTIEGNAGSVTFPALSSSVTSDAAVDPTKPADYQPNSATTAFISLVVMAFAILAALL